MGGLFLLYFQLHLDICINRRATVHHWTLSLCFSPWLCPPTVCLLVSWWLFACLSKSTWLDLIQLFLSLDSTWFWWQHAFPSCSLPTLLINTNTKKHRVMHTHNKRALVSYFIWQIYGLKLGQTDFKSLLNPESIFYCHPPHGETVAVKNSLLIHTWSAYIHGGNNELLIVA